MDEIWLHYINVDEVSEHFRSLFTVSWLVGEINSASLEYGSSALTTRNEQLAECESSRLELYRGMSLH